MDKVKEAIMTKKDTDKYGKIARITLEDDSKIYVTKKGWNLVTPKGVEVNLPWNEINMAIDASIQLGYISDSEKEVIE